MMDAGRLEELKVRLRRCWRCKVWGTIARFHKGQYTCKSCGHLAHKAWVRANPKRANELKELDKERLRIKVRNLYNNECAHCGYNNPRALQLDHIKGGGGEEKRRIGTIGIYRKALREPERYQLLCANCNILKLYEKREHVAYRTKH